MSAENRLTRRADLRTISLVGLAHGSSHFFQMMLPPLFPLFIRDFGFSYAELGFLLSVLFIVSGIGQALAGFLVDRIGARPVLFAALGCFFLGAIGAATANGYAGLLLAVVLLGLGNAPFHPVDFTILNKRVSQPRLGHAFSVHGISGNLGWAAGPIVVIGLSTALDSWRMALALCALYALVVTAVLAWKRDAIDDRAGQWSHEAPAAGAAPPPLEHPMAFLRLPSVWLCFFFFFWATTSLSAIQGFAAPSLQAIYQLPLAATSMVVSGYMLCSACGMVIGGFLAARALHLERTIALSLSAAALALLVVSSGALPGAVAAVLAAASGLGVGLAGPSRDMLIKRAAPPGATGRVYGTVYSGLDLGFAVAAPVFGAMLDRGMAAGVFIGAAMALLAAVASATLVGRHVGRAPTPVKVAA